MIDDGTGILIAAQIEPVIGIHINGIIPDQVGITIEYVDAGIGITVNGVVGYQVARSAGLRTTNINAGIVILYGVIGNGI